ncbi:TonB-dependent receptor domain-containing protein [Altererythrobacter sp. Root672]|uniref:TonB-dependent receptor domain-containing protein n=1 Tax=Altererythrobacter sp. Root672 TaxID=1736584 RepID=UPI000702239E|nr:TonB-dependent receptor [Altererythrobacter sp. Root672]KRA84160.1 TonB-dependent receptor [Altererythrobacter sp. Root672]
MNRNVFSAMRLGGSLAALAFATSAVPAFGQEADAADEQETNNAGGVIVVTGSLIQRPNNTSVSPIITVGQEDIREAGTATLQDALNQVPSFTVGGNAATGGQGTGGRASINLHGLGTNRNLVLLDGRRLPVSDIAGNVDINILPEVIIGGVDVITGGASAIYGSDAMSGVVNFKTLPQLDGFRVDALSSISERGDAFKFNGALAFGTDFAENRGHLITAFSYSKQDPVDGSRREFFHDKTPSSFIGTGTFVPSATNAPSAAVLQTVFSQYGITGTRNPLLNLGFNNDQTLFVQTGAVNYRGPTDGNGYMVIGGNVRMPVGQQIQFHNALERKTAFVKGDYDLTSSLNLYGQFMYVDLTVNTESGGSLTQFPALTTIPVTNPFIPADLRTVLASRPQATAPFTWNGRYVGVPDKNWDENYRVAQYLAGLRGDITDGWSFDVFASYDESQHNQTMHNAVLKSQVYRLLNAPDGGASLCAGGFNPFGDANARSLSDACVSFITKNARSVEDLSQTQVQGQINGEIFDLGAGPVQVALLAAYRKNTYEFSPDSDLVSPNAFNLIVPSNPGGNIEGVVNTLPVPPVAINVKELAAQIDIPLLANVPFAEELAVGGAARISDYSVTGSVTSYELDARWRPVEALLFRGSYQRAVRAPNIGELFSPPQGAQLVIGTPPGALGDPCDVRSTARTGANGAQVAALCVAQGVPAAAISSYQFPTTATGQVISGSTALSPERANTFNFGFVLDSPISSGVFSDISLSVDYFNITINDVISTVPGLTVLSSCFNLDGSNPTYSNSNDFCTLITRDTLSGQILNVATPYQNLGRLKTDGIEAQLSWNIPLGLLDESGSIDLNSAIGWLNNYEIQQLPGVPPVDYTGVSVGGAGTSSVPPRATPVWKALTTVAYRTDTFGIGLRWRYQSKLKDVSSVLTPANAQVGVPSYQLFDLFGSVRIEDEFELRAGINNLFDKELPFVASSQNGTDTALYDAIGRSFYVGVRFGF